MKKIILAIAMISLGAHLNAQTEYPIIQPTIKVNNSPWYGLGRSNILLGSQYESVQLAGYYGLLLKTANGELSMNTQGNVGIGTTNPDSKLRIEGSNSLARFKTEEDGFFEIQATRSTTTSKETNLKLSSQGHIILDPNAFGTQGNVGIGTTNPFTNLQIHGNGTDTRIALTNNTSGKNASDGFVIINENDNEIHFLNRENAALKFSTNESERMRIDKIGNVGIGTSSPSSKLHIVNTTNAGTISKNGINISRYTTANANLTSYDKGLYSHAGHYSIAAGVTDSGYKIGVDASSFSYTDNFKGTLKSSFGIWARAGIYRGASGAKINNAIAVNAEVLDNVAGSNIDNIYGVKIATNNYKKSTVTNRYDLYAGTSTAKNYFAGKVGIGTTIPSEKFEVKGNVKFNSISNHTHIRIGKENNDAFISDNSTQKNYGGGYFFRVHNDNITHKYIDVMMLGENGNVGIGVKSNDNYKLAIAGKMISEEVTVKLKSSWPDYVFTNDYKLPTLQEVEQHIKEKGHLANIPSAKEVEENGVEIGEMNKKLLEKVEELTLYTIQQEKDLKNQEERIKKQESEIKALKKQNKEIEKLKKLVNQLIDSKK